MVNLLRGSAVAAILCALFFGGCAQLDFGSHASFDSWFTGSVDALPVKEIGFCSLDGGFAGTLVNDILIRTPALIAQEASCLLLSPFALPYYGVRSLSGGGEDPAPPS